jgi:hypothetical protein
MDTHAHTPSILRIIEEGAIVGTLPKFLTKEATSTGRSLGSEEFIRNP